MIILSEITVLINELSYIWYAVIKTKIFLVMENSFKIGKMTNFNLCMIISIPATALRMWVVVERIRLQEVFPYAFS